MAAAADTVALGATSSYLYRAVWRWHFYAGLLTLPFLISLAVTGGIYLFKDEIDARVYHDRLVVMPGDGSTLAPEAVVARALDAVPGTVLGYVPPPTAERSARVFIATAGAGERDVFVDPYTGRVLGNELRGDYGNLPLMAFVRRVHSLEQIGWIGNRLVEIVAGWTLILVATGIFLWWPRGQSGGVVTIRGNRKQRLFWRDLHAVTGAFAAASIAFLAMTGLPWSGFWGAGFKHYVNEAGLGYPEGYWSPVQQSSQHGHDGERLGAVPWALDGADAPGPPAQVSEVSAGLASTIGLDRAIEIFERHGMPGGYTLSMPRSATGVYGASAVPDDVTRSRVIYLDQYDGAVLFDSGYTDFGVGGRAVEFGTSIHVGQQFGRINQLVMLLACVAVVLMSISAAVMWWKRRPRGALGAPRYPDDFRVPRTILCVAVAVGVLLPLVGLSLLVMLALDFSVPNRWRARLC